MPIFAAGVLVNSALYFIAILWAGIAWGEHEAVKVDIIAIGATYLAYSVQCYDPGHAVSRAMVAASVVLGAIAGMLLL